jgi:carbamoyl-phosphate synthase large subunit
MKKVLLTSIGRRTYLARYFAAAFGSEHVFVADADEAAPGMHVGFTAAKLPPISSDSYLDGLNEVVRSRGIDLIVSLHDREVATLSRLRSRIEPNCSVLGMPSENWDVGLDKYRTHLLLTKAGIAAPPTISDPDLVCDGLERGEIQFPLVLKPRFGSASIGVSVEHDLGGLQRRLKESLTGPVLIQQFVEGVEHGLDVICDLQGNYLGALARRKLRMSGGETDDAVTVDPEPFNGLARAIADTTRHRGLIDIDVVIDPRGHPLVIDVNPRFGGGYPFSHEAAADVPSVLLKLLEGEPFDPSALRATPGSRFRKTIALVRVQPRAL